MKVFRFLPLCLLLFCSLLLLPLRVAADIITDDSGLKYRVSEEGYAVIEGYDVVTTDLVIPEMLGGYPVKEIAQSALYRNQYLTSLVLPEGLTAVGKNAFAFCENLTKVTLPGSLTVIPEGCFQGCPLLTTLTLSEGLTAIEPDAFAACIRLKTVRVPSTLQSIGADAFEDCEQLLLLCENNDYVRNYAETWHIPTAFTETKTFQILTLGGATVLLGGAAVLLRIIWKKRHS